MILAKRGRELTRFRPIVGAGIVALLSLSLWKFRDGMFSGLVMLAMNAFVAGFLVALLWFSEREHRQPAAKFGCTACEHGPMKGEPTT